jgi:SpoVK/Ycf46/Vps4 family AAA+-type ATPase
MARAALIENLAVAALDGDQAMIRKIVTAMAAEAMTKNHVSHADNLYGALKLADKKSSACARFASARQSQAATAVPHCLESSPQRSISDLVLPGDVVQVCNELAREHTEAAELLRYRLTPRSKILLTGPPGCGKTSLAEAVATALQVPLYTILYECMIGSYLGETGKRMRDVFSAAATQACVLFFDEFEAVAKERGDAHEVGELKRVVSSLLTNIDRLPHHVVVVAASNHPELLDRAVRRRFQICITLVAPVVAQAAEFFRKYEQRSGVSFGVDVQVLAEKVLEHLNNFAEIEEFTNSVLRDFVLDKPSGGMKSAVERKLAFLERREPRDKWAVAG